MNFSYFQNTTTRWAVSNERQHGGVEKKTPIDTSLTKADGGTIGRMVLGEHYAHHTGSPMQTRCQEKAPTDQGGDQLGHARSG